MEQARVGSLGELLRSHRERLRPVDVGLPDRGRRRTPGLRREEVAELANVSATYYTFLEQGRATRPSPEVLDALARALRFDPLEHRYLRDTAFAVSQASADSKEVVPRQVRRLVRQLDPQPTYVKGRRWDVLAANASAVALFSDWGAGGGEGPPNMLKWMLTNDAARQLYADWESEARGMLARFRAACAQRPNDTEAARLLEEIRGSSSEVASWWSRHEVAPIGCGTKELHHHAVGRLALEHAVLHVGDDPAQHLVSFSSSSDEVAATFEILHALGAPRGC
jgi:transcriptional regulator with XRE-family HTH domain